MRLFENTELQGTLDRGPCGYRGVTALYSPRYGDALGFGIGLECWPWLLLGLSTTIWGHSMMRPFSRYSDGHFPVFDHDSHCGSYLNTGVCSCWLVFREKCIQMLPDNASLLGCHIWVWKRGPPLLPDGCVQLQSALVRTCPTISSSWRIFCSILEWRDFLR